MDIKQNQYNQCSCQNQQHNPKNSCKDISSFDALTEYAINHRQRKHRHISMNMRKHLRKKFVITGLRLFKIVKMEHC